MIVSPRSRRELHGILDDRYQEAPRRRDTHPRLRAQGGAPEGDPQGPRARGPARKRRVQGGEGATELPAGSDRAAPPAPCGALHDEPRPHPQGEGGPRLDRDPQGHRERGGRGLRDRDPRGDRSDSRTDLALLADRALPPEPRGGRDGRGEGPLREPGVRDRPPRHDPRSGPGRISERHVAAGAALPPFVRLPLSAELDFKDVPPAPGVAEFLGADERSLLVGRPQNLQRFVKNHLGRGPAPKKGARPPLDLSAIALLVRYATTGSLFEQRLLFERTLTVPREKRPDLKDAYFVALDPEERFPRFRIAHGDPAQEGLFGPLRGRAQAEGAIESLTARFPLRPCDYVFEPREDLALGLGCLFAQTRTCPAPCLVRIGEGDYREIARGAVRLLEDPRLRDEGAPLPSFVGRSLGSAGLVVIPKER